MYKILSIDGGGMRGIIPGKILEELERIIQDELHDSNIRISDCFDLIVGTSTGGILTCLYRCPSSGSNRPKYSASDVVGIYVDRGEDIFHVPTFRKFWNVKELADEKYPSNGIEEVFEDYFSDLKISDLLGDFLVTAYNIKLRNTVFFRKPDLISGIPDPNRNFLARDVARATSAAPTYFEAARIKSESNIPQPLVDGGLFANNPALCAYAEAIARKKAVGAKEMLILSLGTGYALQSYNYDEAKDWGILDWARPTIDILMSGQSETVDYQLKQLFSTLGDAHKDQYIRIDEALPTYVSSDMDNATPENISSLVEFSSKVIEKNRANLKSFARLICQEKGALCS